MLFFNWLIDESRQPPWVIEAKSKPLLDELGNRLVNVLPDNADATILDRLRGGGEAEASDAEASATE
jgi:membrane protein required for colicin V production